MKWLVIPGVLIAGLLLFGGYNLLKIYSPATSALIPSIVQSTPTALPTNQNIEVIASNLYVPWALDFLPSGELLTTERSGRVLLIKGDEKIELIKIDDVVEKGEGGLMGMAIDPKFGQTSKIFFYYTYEATDNSTKNRVVSYQLVDQKLTNRQLILDAIPGALFHNGGRLKFGSDGFLYITTGDAQEPSRAQDLNSLAGKILRITVDGKAAAGNPFNSLVWSYGHRNPQGITWDNQGKLWSTEHGPSGIGADCCRDELNQIQSGNNYGWPLITGDKKQAGLISPVIHSGNSQAWAPGGMAYADGSIYFAGLKGTAIYKYNIETKEMTALYQNQWGRIRDIVIGADKQLYITTSNRDGRGKPSTADDQIIRLPVPN